MTTTALITGANGFVGSHLAEELLRRGYAVRALVRPTSNLRWLKDLPVTLVHGDVRDRHSLDGVVDGVDALFHTAGVIKANSLGAYLDANLRGTEHIVAAAARSGRIRRFVHVSSLAAAGPSPDGTPVSEEAPCRPVSLYGISKLRGEEAAREIAGTMALTVIRPPAVFGPRDEGVLEFFKIAAAGVVPALDGRRYYSIVHVGDLVRGIADAAESPAAAGRTYFLAYDDPVELSQIVRIMVRAIRGRPRYHIHIPLRLLMGLASCVETVASLTGRTTFVTRHKIREIGQRWWTCSSAAARRDFGFCPSASLETAIAATARWYIENGWIRT